MRQSKGLRLYNCDLINEKTTAHEEKDCYETLYRMADGFYFKMGGGSVYAGSMQAGGPDAGML